MHMRKMGNRVLMTDIARRLGVHQTTVSRALSDHPRIGRELRGQIKRVAAEMGYAPDPHLRALAKYRARSKAPEFRGLLGWLTNFETRDGWRVHEKLSYFKGARERAKELGYDLEVFWLREPRLRVERLGRILTARGIRGVLLPPQPVAGTKIALPLEGLAAVSFGHSLVEPDVHVVHHHHYRSMQRLLAELEGLGYRRPGLALAEHFNRSVGGMWSAAYADDCQSKGRKPRSLMVGEWRPEPLMQWMAKAKPDVVVSEDARVLEWLRQGGVRIPEQCGFALTARHPGHPDCAGIDENSEVVGAAAVDLLTSLVERGETGLPKHPINLLVEGTWSPKGETVRRTIA